MRHSRLVVLIGVTMLVGACGSTEPDEPSVSLGQAIASTWLASSARVDFPVVLLGGSSSGPISTDASFPCPNGGTIALSVRGARVVASGQTDATWTSVATLTRCAVGQGAQAITLAGAVNGSGNSSWQAPGGSLALLSLRAEYSGSVSWSGSSASSCSFALTTTSKGNATQTTGTACGQPVVWPLP